MAEDRKARLAALAARAGRKTENHEANATSEKKAVSVKFRNYAPNDDSLDQEMQEPASKRLRQNDMDAREQAEITGKAKKEEGSELEKALTEAKADVALAGQDPSLAPGPASTNLAANALNTAPKKVNWDLKRDIAKKMNRLERRTQKAVVELLRVRLEREAEEEDDDLD